jgi:hypothetical protein
VVFLRSGRAGALPRNGPLFLVDEETMRNLLALLGFALVTFLVVGYYLNWYHITPQSANPAGHQGVVIDINKKKIGDDVNRGLKAGEEAVHDAIDKNDKSAPSSTPR